MRRLNKKGAGSFSFFMRNVCDNICGKSYTIILCPKLARKNTQKFDRILLPPTCVGPPPSRREAKGFAQISMFLQRISFVSVIFHIKIGIFYLNQFALTMEFRQTFSIKYSYLTFYSLFQYEVRCTHERICANF